MEKIILFISKYSEENYLLAKHLCLDQKHSCSFFYNNSSIIGGNYIDVVSEAGEDFYKKSFVSFYEPSQEESAVEIYDFINNLLVVPDAIVCKGDIVTAMPIASVKEISGIEVPIVLFLENVKKEYSKEEIMAINNFDYVIAMDDEGTNIDVKKVLVPDFSLSFVKNKKDLNIDYLEFNQNEDIIFSNNKNYKKICDEINEYKRPINVCSYEEMSEKEILVLALASRRVFDMTDNEYFNFIISKIGVRNTKVKEFQDIGVVENEKISDFETNLNFKDFFDFIEKEIYMCIENEFKDHIAIKASEI